MSLPELLAKGNGHVENHFEWAARMETMLRDVLENITSEIAEDQYLFLSGQQTVAGTDTDGIVTIGPVPAGAAWNVKQIATTGANAGPCTVYLDAVAPQNLIDFVSNAGTFADGRDFVVPPMRTLLFHFYNQAAGQKLTANIQCKQFVYDEGQRIKGPTS